MRLGGEGPGVRRSGAMVSDGRPGRRGKKQGRGKEKGKKLTCGPRVSERKGRAGEGERSWARLAAREREERKRGESTRAGPQREKRERGGKMGRAWPTRGEGGRGEREMGCGKKGPAQGEESELVGLPSLILFPFSFSKLTQINLNPNEI
jgi:hypothetical protein